MKEKRIEEQLAVVTQRKDGLLAKLTQVHALERDIEFRIIRGMTPVMDINGKALTQENIKLQINALAGELMVSVEKAPILISVMDGALPFAAELHAELSAREYAFQYETIQVSSYVGTTSGELSINSSLKVDVGGKDIIVVDDVCDTGKTYHALRLLLLELGAASVNLMVLVDKKQERLNDESHPSYAGFTVSPDAFVAGWGMDYEGLLRNYVKEIGAVDPSTLPDSDETALLNSKKALNLELQDCLASEKELNGLLKACRTPLQQDSFYYNCLIGLAFAGIGSALIAYGIYTENTISSTIGVVLAAGGVTGLYNYGLFSTRAENIMSTQPVCEPVVTEFAM